MNIYRYIFEKKIHVCDSKKLKQLYQISGCVRQTILKEHLKWQKIIKP